MRQKRSTIAIGDAGVIVVTSIVAGRTGATTTDMPLATTPMDRGSASFSVGIATGTGDTVIGGSASGSLVHRASVKGAAVYPLRPRGR